MSGNVVTLTDRDFQRKRLQTQGRSIFVEFFCAPGCDIADASVEDWPVDLTFHEMATWLRSFAHELDQLAEAAKNPEEMYEQGQKDPDSQEPG